MADGTGKSVQERFYDWVTEEVPPAQRSQLRSVLDISCEEIGHFGRQQGILTSGPLFNTTDPDVIKKVSDALELDTSSCFVHQCSLAQLTSAIALYCEFLEEQSALSPDTQLSKLSEELQELLFDDDLAPLRDTLLSQGILTLEEFQKTNVWVFMNRFDLYPINQRQGIYKRIWERLDAQSSKIPDQPCNPDAVHEQSTTNINPEQADDAKTKNGLIQQVEKTILDMDLDGITLDVLCKKLGVSKSGAKRLVADSKRVVALGDRLFHEDAFVDWEDGANQIEQILEKLLNKNSGYVSSAQLYEYAHANMQMFLNDNGIDDPGMVYDMAQHLFEKIDYHGKHLLFQLKNHISRGATAITSNLDVIRNYARNQGGFFREEELIEYLQRVGIKTGNLRGQMRVYDAPIFLFYDLHTYMTAESMDINAGWLTQARNALDNLFAELGDHIVLRDIPSWWYMQLPLLPGSRTWTTLLLQSVLRHYSNNLGGARTICGLSTQTGDTLHTMLVSGASEVQTFADTVAAFLTDGGIEQRRFEAEELRQMLVRRGMVAGSELIGNMPKALAKDERFIWSIDGKYVTIRM